jgi:hypothetical protein
MVCISISKMPVVIPLFRGCSSTLVSDVKVKDRVTLNSRQASPVPQRTAPWLARFPWIRMLTLSATYLNKAHLSRPRAITCSFLSLHFYRNSTARRIETPTSHYSRCCAPCRSHVERSAKLQPPNTILSPQTSHHGGLRPRGLCGVGSLQSRA